MNRLPGLGTALLLMLLGSLAVGQEESKSAAKMDKVAMTQRSFGEEETSGRTSSKMEHMADAMESMAKTCDAMMKKEMAMFPVKMVAAAVLGTIAAIALILLLVLEVQWIRLLALKIKGANRELHDKRSA